MKHRNIMAVIFFSILTLGIYDLFWLVRVKKELNQKTSVHTPSLWLLFAPVLLMVAALIAVVAMSASSLDSSNTVNGSGATAAANIAIILVYLVSLLVIIPVTFYWFFKFSKAVSEYTHGELNTAVTFILLYLLRFIGLAVIQDKFNDMIAAGATPAGPNAPAEAFNPVNPAQTAAADPLPPTQPEAPQSPTDDVSPNSDATPTSEDANQNQQPPQQPIS